MIGLSPIRRLRRRLVALVLVVGRSRKHRRQLRKGQLAPTLALYVNSDRARARAAVLAAVAQRATAGAEQLNQVRRELAAGDPEIERELMLIERAVCRSMLDGLR